MSCCAAVPINKAPSLHSVLVIRFPCFSVKYNAVPYITQSIFSKIFTKYIPSGRGMGWLLWVQPLIDILSQFLQWCIRYLVILDRVIAASHCGLLWMSPGWLSLRKWLIFTLTQNWLFIVQFYVASIIATWGRRCRDKWQLCVRGALVSHEHPEILDLHCFGAGWDWMEYQGIWRGINIGLHIFFRFMSVCLKITNHCSHRESSFLQWHFEADEQA